MDIPQRCEEIRERVEELAAAATEEARNRILVQALYQASDQVLGPLGSPNRTERYAKGQEAALDLLAYLCRPLVREAQGNTELVALLVEIAEGTADPVLQKKLDTCRRQILAQAQVAERSPAAPHAGWYLGVFGFVVVALGGLLVAVQPQRSAVLSRDGGPEAAGEATQSAAAPLRSTPAQRETAPAPAELVSRHAVSQKGEKGEAVTRIRVVANQVLVPVTVRNGTEAVKATLLLDTGSTRTALVEQFAPKLGIDLSRARGALVEVADGRVLHAKLAPVDRISVGPREAAAMEVEFYPYSGGDPGFDGFLGMDFLGRHRYQLDVENEVIRWF